MPGAEQLSGSLRQVKDFVKFKVPGPAHIKNGVGDSDLFKQYDYVVKSYEDSGPLTKYNRIKMSGAICREEKYGAFNREELNSLFKHVDGRFKMKQLWYSAAGSCGSMSSQKYKVDGEQGAGILVKSEFIKKGLIQVTVSKSMEQQFGRLQHVRELAKSRLSGVAFIKRCFRSIIHNAQVNKERMEIVREGAIVHRPSSIEFYDPGEKVHHEVEATAADESHVTGEKLVNKWGVEALKEIKLFSEGGKAVKISNTSEAFPSSINEYNDKPTQLGKSEEINFLFKYMDNKFKLEQMCDNIIPSKGIDKLARYDVGDAKYPAQENDEFNIEQQFGGFQHVRDFAKFKLSGAANIKRCFGSIIHIAQAKVSHLKKHDKDDPVGDFNANMNGNAFVKTENIVEARAGVSAAGPAVSKYASGSGMSVYNQKCEANRRMYSEKSKVDGEGKAAILKQQVGLDAVRLVCSMEQLYSGVSQMEVPDGHMLIEYADCINKYKADGSTYSQGVNSEGLKLIMESVYTKKYNAIGHEYNKKYEVHSYELKQPGRLDILERDSCMERLFKDVSRVEEPDGLKSSKNYACIKEYRVREYLYNNKYREDERGICIYLGVVEIINKNFTEFESMAGLRASEILQLYKNIYALYDQFDQGGTSSYINPTGIGGRVEEVLGTIKLSLIVN